MIRRTATRNLLRGEREVDYLQAEQVRTVADALPVECLDAPEGLLAVHVNGGPRLPRSAWSDTLLADGDELAIALLPGDPGTLVVAAVTVIISAWQIYDATRRAKIQAHHATRRAASRSKQMQDSPTYGFGGIVNTINPGGPIAILFGRHRVGGQVILGNPIAGTIDLKIAIGEGQLNGREVGSVEINGKPIGKYPAVTVREAAGTIAGTSFSSLFGTSASLVTARSTPRRSTDTNVIGTPPNAGAYWYGNDVSFYGTAQIGQGGTHPTASIKRTSNGSGGTVGEVDGFSVQVAINSGVPVFNRAVNGVAAISLDVEYRTPIGGGAFTSAGAFNLGPFRVLGGNAGSVVLSGRFKVGPLALAQYDTRVTVNAGNSTLVADDGAAVTLNTALAIDMQPLLEFQEFDRLEPGLAVLGIEGLPAASVGGALPTVTSIWEGRILADIATVGPPATFTSESYTGAAAGYTRGQNPALVILDLLRNIRYGIGGELDIDNDVDLNSIIDARNFCDELVPRGLGATGTVAPWGTVIESGTADGDIGAADQFDTTQSGVDFTATVKTDDTLRMLTGSNQGTYRVGAVLDANSLRLTTHTPPFASVSLTIEAGNDWEIQATERRCLTDFYFDGVSNIWDAIASIARTNRLGVVWSSGKLKLVPDDDRSGVIAQRFHMGNLESFSQQFNGDQSSNRVEVQFLDAEKNWEQALTQYEDPQQLIDRTEPVKTMVEAYGVTRRSQALRLAKYHWLSNRLEREMIEFEVDATALTLEWGDVIEVVHDAVREVGQGVTMPSGRVREVIGDVVVLDDWHTFDLTSFGQVVVVQRSDTDGTIQIDVPLSDDGLKIDRFDPGGWGAYTPQPGDLWHHQITLVDSALPDLWKVTSLTLSQDHRRKVQAVRHNPDMYERRSTNAGVWIEDAPLSETDPV